MPRLNPLPVVLNKASNRNSGLKAYLRSRMCSKLVNCKSKQFLLIKKQKKGKIMEITNFVGIDISKLTFNLALIIGGNKENIIDEEFTNDLKGIKQMKKWLQSSQGIKLDETVFCMEHTGIYCRTIVDFLVENKCSVWLEMSVAIIRSMGLQRGKNDKIDARRIALYAYKNREDIKLWQAPRKVIVQLRDLLTLRERLIKSKQSLLVPIKELRQTGNKQSAGILLKSCKATIRALEGDIEKVEEQTNQMIKGDVRLSELFQLVTSVPGVGKITAMYLICFTNEFTLYKNAKQLACYCGVAPFEHSSGTSVIGKPRVSHMANKILKCNLHLGAMSVIDKIDEFKCYYDRKTKEGKNKMSVINAVRNKIIHRVIAVVKRGTPYVNEYKLAV